MTLFFYLSIILLVSLVTLKFFFQTKKLKNFPPSPPHFPIIGNLQQIKQPLHQSFYELAKKYGKIFSLRFGSCLVVVVSSYKTAQECFTKNDVTFSNRPKLLLGKYIGYNYTAVVFAPYGDHWRNLRHIITLELLSSHRLNSSLEIQTEEIMRLLQKLGQVSCKDFVKVELKSKFKELTFNPMMRVLAGKRYYGEDVDPSDLEEANKFREIMNELGKFGDFIPTVWSRLFDLFSENGLKKTGEKLDAFIQKIVDEHRARKQDDNSMIGHLLKQQQAQPEYYTDQIIKGLLMDLLNAGTDTSAVTLEWVISNLVNNPEILNKLRKEIDTEIGQDRLMIETDVPKLPYLQNVVSETLRLHPAAPLLVPHFSSDECTVGEYKVPKDTTLYVNIWAIHRDPDLWKDPMVFRPERFEKEGEVNKLISFGIGRRACPGENMAQRTLTLGLGLLVQCFDWKRIGEELVDLSEGQGITVPKKYPLEAMCRMRHIPATKSFI
ncbi:PREDICTED: cytochrome P450 81E8-like [Lupinus angustifolius]|uniref:cytochrome P450 81E8-like n=1 Tax=Lupinus angustifolius TaxID=3871 RepID=UPI00092F7C3B|nr:PREDICTED: cytochrome P450 81E8-like [Lupinus angustifolius]